MTTNKNSKLKEMLIGYAAAHQHPVNVAAHLIGIPIIMLGVAIPLSWAEITIGPVTFTLAHVLVVGFFAFYLTLDSAFALVFLALGLLIAEAAVDIGTLPLKTASIIAAAAFFGGYALQFAGHAIEKSMPVLVRHPIQAQLAAPFFTIVEIFGLLGLRKELFAEVHSAVEQRRAQDASA